MLIILSLMTAVLDAIAGNNDTVPDLVSSYIQSEGIYLLHVYVCIYCVISLSLSLFSYTNILNLCSVKIMIGMLCL